jgi:hypothetical protein
MFVRIWRLVMMKLAGKVELAWMPPTFAAGPLDGEEGLDIGLVGEVELGVGADETTPPAPTCAAANPSHSAASSSILRHHRG